MMCTLIISISTFTEYRKEIYSSNLRMFIIELKKILTIISTALTIEHKIIHRRTPRKLEVGPGAREE